MSVIDKLAKEDPVGSSEQMCSHFTFITLLCCQYCTRKQAAAFRGQSQGHQGFRHHRNGRARGCAAGFVLNQKLVSSYRASSVSVFHSQNYWNNRTYIYHTQDFFLFFLKKKKKKKSFLLLQKRDKHRHQ